MQYKKLNNRVAFELYLKEPMKLLFSHPAMEYNKIPHRRDINTVLAVDFAENSGWSFFVENEPLTVKVLLPGDSEILDLIDAEVVEDVQFNRHLYYEVTVTEAKEPEEG